MPLFDNFRKKVRRGENEGWPSIVFLIRDPHLPSPKEALQLARQAWGAAGSVDLIKTVRENCYVFRASDLIFGLYAAPGRYEIDGLSRPAVQQQCWDQHTAWLSVDLPGRRTEDLRKAGTLASAYGSLMFFVNKYWSPNCLAIYFPDEGVTIPNQGDLIQSIRWSAGNGADLRFLQEPKKV